jgi:hypothetical protein
MEQTINMTISNPIINNDKEVFTDKREFINHCLMVLGHLQGLEVKLVNNSGTNVHVLFFTDRFGHERIWNASYKGEQTLWDDAFTIAENELANLNSNRTYNTKESIQDAIDQAIYPEYKRYWQDLLDILVAEFTAKMDQVCA